MSIDKYQTINVSWHEDICYLQIFRPNFNNTINDLLIQEVGRVLEICEEKVKILVLEGMPEVFCFGADFDELQASISQENKPKQNPEPLYELWSKLASGSYISIAHVRGKTNAGGVGFVAACDIVLCEEQSTFSLSELLFGLMPACVLPFLIRRIDVSKANYMTLMSQPISAAKAHEWGLVDAYHKNSSDLLRKHILRLRLLPKSGIGRYKTYMNSLSELIPLSRQKAIDANREVFGDEENLRKLDRYIRTGVFPWESEAV